MPLKSHVNVKMESFSRLKCSNLSQVHKSRCEYVSLENQTGKSFALCTFQSPFQISMQMSEWITLRFNMSRCTKSNLDVQILKSTRANGKLIAIHSKNFQNKNRREVYIIPNILEAQSYLPLQDFRVNYKFIQAQTDLLNYNYLRSNTYISIQTPKTTPQLNKSFLCFFKSFLIKSR